MPEAVHGEAEGQVRVHVGDALHDATTVTGQQAGGRDAPVATVAADKAPEIRVSALETFGNADHIPVMGDLARPVRVLADASAPELLHGGRGGHARQVYQDVEGGRVPAL